MIKKFRGKKIFIAAAKYPAVYWPEHPVSDRSGIAYIHRIVAYDKYGELPKNYHVHHKDYNPLNFSKDNLELLSSAAHKSRHSRVEKMARECSFCGAEVVSSTKRHKQQDRVYCSKTCKHNKMLKINWPSVEGVQQMVKECGFSATGRKLGVSDNAVRKFLNRNA